LGTHEICPYEPLVSQQEALGPGPGQGNRPEVSLRIIIRNVK